MVKVLADAHFWILTSPSKKGPRSLSPSRKIIFKETSVRNSTCCVFRPERIVGLISVLNRGTGSPSYRDLLPPWRVSVTCKSFFLSSILSESWFTRGCIFFSKSVTGGSDIVRTALSSGKSNIMSSSGDRSSSCSSVSVFFIWTSSSRHFGHNPNRNVRLPQTHLPSCSHIKVGGTSSSAANGTASRLVATSTLAASRSSLVST